jgi:hypothetical protein
MSHHARHIALAAGKLASVSTIRSDVSRIIRVPPPDEATSMPSVARCFRSSIAGSDDRFRPFDGRTRGIFRRGAKLLAANGRARRRCAVTHAWSPP